MSLILFSAINFYYGNMAAARRVLCALLLLSLISAFIFILARNISTSSSSLLYKHRVTRSFRRAASLRLTVLKHSKHGTYAVSLPFDSNVALQCKETTQDLNSWILENP